MRVANGSVVVPVPGLFKAHPSLEFFLRLHPEHVVVVQPVLDALYRIGLFFQLHLVPGLQRLHLRRVVQVGFIQLHGKVSAVQDLGRVRDLRPVGAVLQIHFRPGFGDRLQHGRFRNLLAFQGFGLVHRVRVRLLIVFHRGIQGRHGRRVLSLDVLGGVFHVARLPDLDQLHLHHRVFADFVHVPGADQLFPADFPFLRGIGACVLVLAFQVFPVYVVQVVHRVVEFLVQRPPVNDHVRDIPRHVRVDHQSGVLLISGGSVQRDSGFEVFFFADIIRGFLRHCGQNGASGHQAQGQHHADQLFHFLSPPFCVSYFE